jgi:DNA-binding NarL/FixJ family response regulator
VAAGEAAAGEAAAWEQAAAAWEEAREPYPLAIALFRAAEAALASGSAKEAAVTRLRRAADIATDLGARPLGDAVTLLARRAGIRTDGAAAAQRASAAGQQATGAGLTPRELEVLRLIAAGMSNARIAGELFISPKTASVHVSNIMSKLGATNRGEAAATAHRLRLLGTPQAG